MISNLQNRSIRSARNAGKDLNTAALLIIVFRETAEVRSHSLYLPLRDLTPFRCSVEEPLLGLRGVWVDNSAHRD
jgi:hypothetical protein